MKPTYSPDQARAIKGLTHLLHLLRLVLLMAQLLPWGRLLPWQWGSASACGPGDISTGPRNANTRSCVLTGSPRSPETPVSLGAQPSKTTWENPFLRHNPPQQATFKFGRSCGVVQKVLQ